jgi:uncharacterized protein (DUF488 family)
MCVERTAEDCHRSILVDALNARLFLVNHRP